MTKNTAKICVDKTLGYEYINDSSHPDANKSGKVYVHRIVASRKLGRKLSSWEHVHHIDGNKRNNNPDNLQVLSASEHLKETQRLLGHIKNYRYCLVCGKITSNKKYCSTKCSSVMSRKILLRPTNAKILEDLKTMSMIAVGKKYKVSDGAVRKWLGWKK